MTTFAEASARRGILAYWWVRIEGLQYRYSTLKSGTDAIHDAMTDMYPWLAGPPSIGGQTADPLNGKCSIPSHAFTLFDRNDAITALVSVSDTPWYRTYLTAPITAAETSIPCEDNSEFPSTGTLYLDRETVTYASKGSNSDTDTAAAGLGGQTATGGTTDRLHDIQRDEDQTSELTMGIEGVHFWAGSIVTVTGGTNNGETRTVEDSYWDVDNIKGVLIFDSPMPAACDATTVYTIYQSPLRIETTTLAGADDIWRGAVVEVTAGTNLGESRWVRTWDLSENLLELVSPMPLSCDATTDFKITLKTFGGVTRGKWESDAVEHLLVDENGAVVRRPLSDKIPFWKTRKAWIYENRIGCAESEAIVSVGVIKDFSLSNNHTSYTFQCSGLLELLGGKLLSGQAVGHIRDKPLWGGSFELRHGILWETSALGANFYYDSSKSQWHYGFVMSNGDLVGFTVDRILFKSHDAFPKTGGHIKIDEELIHYDSIKNDSITIDAALREAFVLSDTRVVFGDVQNYWDNENDDLQDEDMPTVAGYENRSLFADLVGLPAIVSDWRITEKSASYLEHVGGQAKQPLMVAAFLTEHQVDAEIKQAMACYDNSHSEFQRYDRIDYSSMAGGAFAVGDTITGGTSGQTAVIMADDAANDVLIVAFVDTQVDSFTLTEQIANGGGQTADVDVYRKEIRPRNNAIDVFLQLVLSTGTVGANGMYDTLPEGFGLGLDESFVDVSAIETLRDKYFAGTQINFVMHEPTSTKAFLEKNIFMPLQVFPFESTNGKISLAYLMTYQEAVAANAASSFSSLGEDALPAVPLPGWGSGKPPIGKLSVRYNKHPCKKEYLGPDVEIIFGNVKEWYGDMGRNIKLDMPTLYHPDGDIKRVRHQDVRIPALLRRMMGIIWDRYAQYPCPVIGVQASYDKVDLNVGDGVLFTQDNLPNMRTSLRGMTDEFFQVMGKAPNPSSGLVDFILWQIGVHDNKFARRAPSAKVASHTFVGGLYTEIGVHDSVFSPPGTSDTASFSAGDEIMFLAADYDKLSNPIETYAIIFVGASTISIWGAVTTPPTDGCWVEYADFDNCTTGQKTSRTFMADPDHVVGTADASAFKYL